MFFHSREEFEVKTIFCNLLAFLKVSTYVNSRNSDIPAFAPVAKTNEIEESHSFEYLLPKHLSHKLDAYIVYLTKAEKLVFFSLIFLRTLTKCDMKISFLI